jgi:hypothetical protein
MIPAMHSSGWTSIDQPFRAGIKWLQERAARSDQAVRDESGAVGQGWIMPTPTEHSIGGTSTSFPNAVAVAPQEMGALPIPPKPGPGQHDINIGPEAVTGVAPADCTDPFAIDGADPREPDLEKDDQDDDDRR